MSLLELIAKFTRPLADLEIEHMVTGGVAAILYGEPRLTQDVDLVVHLEPGMASRLVPAFPSDTFYISPAEVLEAEIARSTGGHFNVLHHDTGFRADLYLRGDDPLLVWGLAHRRWITVRDNPMALAPLEYVVMAKLRHLRDGGTERHLEDIRAMLRVSGDQMDWPMLGRLLAEHGLDQEWHRVDWGESP